MFKKWTNTILIKKDENEYSAVIMQKNLFLFGIGKTKKAAMEDLKRYINALADNAHKASKSGTKKLKKKI